jgi:sialate O-acetylesterase
MRNLYAFFLLNLVCLSISAQLKTARVFADHMVLQRNQQLPVWGTATKSAKVTVAFNGQLITVKADADGNWKAILKPMQAGGPYIMKISTAHDHITFSDVMLGEVWICSGQSNMEFSLNNAFGYRAEQRNAPKMAIRQFQVPKKIALTPDKDLSDGQWVKADTNTVGEFTAVGYFFAKKLSETLHVTVGLINSNWGGTQVEDWISKDAMLASPQFNAVAKSLPANWDGLKQRLDTRLKHFTYPNQHVVYYSAEELATKPAAFFDTWQKGNAPGSWDWQGKTYSYRGEGYMERTIKLDSAYAKFSSVLHLGGTNLGLRVYINGKQVQGDTLGYNYQFKLPAGAWRGGNNTLLVHFVNNGDNTSNKTIGFNANDLNVRFADTLVNLADGNWRDLPDFSRPYHFEFLPNNTAFMLYNTMINPLIPYSIAGVIWYQGESNTSTAYEYRTSFPLLINDWRTKWKNDFPFLFVQLSSFGGFQNSNMGSNWAELREAQTLTLNFPNTGMAVTTDVGDATNIHPRNKADVGYRLAAKALSLTYKLQGFSESPLFKAVDFNGKEAIVNFSYAENGLMAKDKYGYIKGFELAGADHKFYYAQAKITDGNKVRVWCDQVKNPVAVRYAWMDAPLEANLFNKDGFPVSPFRSDNWPGLTEKNKFE